MATALGNANVGRAHLSRHAAQKIADAIRQMSGVSAYPHSTPTLIEL